MSPPFPSTDCPTHRATRPRSSATAALRCGCPAGSPRTPARRRRATIRRSAARPHPAAVAANENAGPPRAIANETPPSATTAAPATTSRSRTAPSSRIAANCPPGPTLDTMREIPRHAERCPRRCRAPRCLTIGTNQRRCSDEHNDFSPDQGGARAGELGDGGRVVRQRRRCRQARRPRRRRARDLDDGAWGRRWAPPQLSPSSPTRSAAIPVER